MGYRYARRDRLRTPVGRPAWSAALLGSGAGFRLQNRTSVRTGASDGRGRGHQWRGRGHGQFAAGHSVGDGDVRAGRRHVADECVDLGGGSGSRYDGERGPVGDCAGGAGVGGVHPDRQQGRRSHRPQARLRPGSARLRDRCHGDGLRARFDSGHHLLGCGGWDRCVAAAAVDAVAHSRQLHRNGTEEGLRPGRCRGCDSRCRRTVARRIHHHLPVVAGRVRPGGPRHRCRAVGHRARPGRALHRTSPHRPGRCSAVGAGHGRHRARHPDLAGRRRTGSRGPGDRSDCDGRADLLVGAAQAPGQADVARSRTCSDPSYSGSVSPVRRSSRSRSAAR